MHIPSIVTLTGGNTETIEDGVSGWVVPIEDSKAITRAFREVSECDKVKLHQFGETAYLKAAEKFKAEIVYNKMQKMYDMILTRSR